MPIAFRLRGRGLSYLVGMVIFLVFITFVHYYLGWDELLAPWRALTSRELAALVGLLIGSYVLRSLRLYSYFREDVQGRFALCLRLMLIHNLLNNLLPMRAGEISFPVLMHRYFAISLVRSLPALAWFRLLDLHTLAGLALLAIGWQRWPDPVVGAVLLGWAMFPYTLYQVNDFLRHSLREYRSRSWVVRVDELLGALPSSAPAFWKSWGWTALNWAAKLLAFAWALRFFADTHWAQAWLGAIGGELTSVFPVHSLAGMGTYEAGVVAALVAQGVRAEVALQAAVNLHLLLLGASLGAGFLALGIRRTRIAAEMHAPE